MQHPLNIWLLSLNETLKLLMSLYVYPLVCEEWVYIGGSTILLAPRRHLPPKESSGCSGGHPRGGPANV